MHIKHYFLAFILSKIQTLLLSRRAWFLTRWSSDIISIVILLKKKTKKDEISNFWPISWVNGFEKISVWRPYNIQILIVYEGLFSTSMIIKSLFPGPFCPKTNKDKIFIFWPKSWVNPFEKWPWDFISRLILLKKKKKKTKRKLPIFLQHHG